jgi:hypothetical protein
MRMVQIQRGGRLFKCDERLAKALDGRAGYLRRDMAAGPVGGSAPGKGEAPPRKSAGGKKNTEGAKPGKRGRKPAAQKEPTE